MARKRLKRKSAQQDNVEDAKMRLLEYEITSEPLQDEPDGRLPAEVLEIVDRLHEAVQKRPRQTIPELEELINRYPHVPLLYNYLSLAYSGAGEKEKMMALILQNYAQNPDYLFAKVHYAEVCLAKQDYEQVAKIFQYKFDLKLLYPRRRRFHVSEYFGLMGVIAPYYLAMGERQMAENILETMQQIDATHQITKRLRRQLYPNLLTRLLKRLVGRRKQNKIMNSSG